MNQLALFGGQPVRTQPFPSWPVHGEREEALALEVLRSGQWWRYTLGEAIDGAASPSKVAEFQQKFAAAHGCKYGIACVNGTAALEIGLKALGVKPGDDVIVPPYTFIATASAPMLIGANPVFCDIDIDTLNLDAGKLEAAITPRTRAIIPVHFAGLAADMEAILEIAARHGIPVLEDAAHGHGGAWRNQPLGSIGAMATFSFQASKNMTAGEGGIVVTNDERLAEIAESLVWVGRKKGRPWYEHHRLGWNYRLTEFQAAILLAQLERLAEQTRRRQENGAWLTAQLEQIPGIRPMAVPAYATGHAWHIYCLRFVESAFGATRERFLEAMAAEGVPGSSGYAHSLFNNPLFDESFQRYNETCAASNRACREAVWFEHRYLLGERADMESIAAAVRKVYENRGELARTA
ncbi:MAG: DegT/DnrJ/EryC1/StrS family aminotransferase [Bryobacterales bacterium]|nr:DegT/DnrJ/EryC1/StrS family aminotransferase [Bryobacterales bacterium]